MPADGDLLLTVGRTAIGLAEKCIQHGGDDDAREAKGKETHPPSIPLGQHRPEPASEDGPGIDARLMERKGPAPRPRPVVVGRQ